MGWHQTDTCVVRDYVSMMRVTASEKRPYLKSYVHGLQTRGMPGQPAADTFDVRLPACDRHNHLRVLAPCIGVMVAKPPKCPIDGGQAGPTHSINSVAKSGRTMMLHLVPQRRRYNCGRRDWVRSVDANITVEQEG